MSLAPGTKLGHFQIVEAIGAGGMDSPRLVKRGASFFYRRHKEFCCEASRQQR